MGLGDKAKNGQQDNKTAYRNKNSMERTIDVDMDLIKRKDILI